MEWNAIDLHMHTTNGITRDKTQDQVDFRYTYLQGVIQRHNMKLMAVTNHNIIDLKNFILMKHLLKLQGANILMGVELDTNLSIGTPIHIATIFEENFKDNYNAMKEINKKTEEKMKDDEICFSNEEIISILGKYNVLMIPHGNKDKGMFKNASREQIEEAVKKVREGFIRIFDSPSDWKLEKIKGFLQEIKEENLDEFGGVLFSDVRDWSKYDDNYRNFYMNAQPTFKGVLHSISNPVQRFKPYNEIKNNNNYISKIKFCNKNINSKILEGEITLSSGYNCIIGKSGSGKSLLLHLIKKHLLRDVKENQNYNFAENTELQIYNEDGRLLDSETINLGIGENLYNKIISASSTNDSYDFYSIISLLNNNFIREEKFNKFKSEYNNKIKEYVKLKIEINSDKQKFITDKNKLFDDIKRLEELKETKIFDVKVIEYNGKNEYTDQNVEFFREYEEKINSLREIAKIYKGKYKDDVNIQIEKLQRIMHLAELDILKIKTENELNELKNKIINDSIENINSLKSTKAEEKSKLLKTLPKNRKSLTELILKIYLNKIIKNNMDLSIDKEKINSEKEINKNVIVIESLTNELLTNVNERENEIFNTNRKKTKLEKDRNYNLTNKKDAKELIDKYIELGIIKPDKDALSEELKVNVEIKFDGQDIKEMNPGNIAKKYIELYFEEQIKNGKNNVVIFDQIENDVDKEFINEVIKSLIGETKGHVQLIVVTHDPIVAVNADPNNYIESIKDEKNRFKYRNFVAESYERDELKTIACNVDGSKDVIKGRYEIYEGEKLYGN